jgi:hypothetical protein
MLRSFHADQQLPRRSARTRRTWPWNCLPVPERLWWHPIGLPGRPEPHLDERDSARYKTAVVIAVTTYSHVFNVNSAFPAVHTLIFDAPRGGQNTSPTPAL